ncbi:hypothetical protein TL18_03360 [Methanobrevibacter sp. YE315]|uniref:hypothetical protein n=1 Tax=Methanobrevibacter sp. YE315 TaxID=1609968 RepID=UPI000764EF88|nr:hypothetical protein [Methanobrevibacter sp. YE315]AMD17141.1 hypothetical protein TL18_03360 [Methanobrevibacter sp. YE315]
MRFKKTYVLAMVLMFLLTLSCAYADENQSADTTLLSSSATEDDVVLSSTIDGDESNPMLGSFEMNYEDLVVKDINFSGNSTHLEFEAFSQDGLDMSAFAMSIIPGVDSSKLDLTMFIPKVSYTNNNGTEFVFENLDLSIAPSSDPSALDFKVLMDNLQLLTQNSYVYLEGLDMFFKSYPEVNGVNLAIAFSELMYGDTDEKLLYMGDLDLDMKLGLDGKSIDLAILLPTLKLITGNNRVDVSDLDLSILLPDLKLANLDLSVIMSDFKYTNLDDVSLNLTDLDLSLEPILDSTDFKAIVRGSTFNFTGLNSSDFQFPGFNISGLNFENITTGLDLSSVDLSGIVSILDVSNMDLSSLVSYLSSGFDITTYTDNTPGKYQSSLDFNAIDLSSTGLSGLNISGLDLGSLFTNMNYSSLSSSVLNLTGLFDSLGINISDFGIDMSGYDLSAINISDISSILSDSNFNMSAITSKLNLSSLDLGGLDISGMISSFNLSSLDISGILGMFNITDFDLSEFMKGFDLEKLLNLFRKQNTTPDSNQTVPSAPSSYKPVKYAYRNVAPKTYTVTRVSDHQIICKSKFFILDHLNKLFNMTFINIHIKVYIDGELVFDGNTTDDLTQVIFEIIDKYLGEHEITVELTDSENKTKTYKEKIIVE